MIKDLDIYIKDNNSIGYAEITTLEGGGYDLLYYQGRLDLSMSHGESINEIREFSKCFTQQSIDPLVLINFVMEFWFLPTIQSINDIVIQKAVPVHEAIKNSGPVIFVECYEDKDFE